MAENRWTLADDLAGGLSGEVPRSPTRPLRSDPAGCGDTGHWVANGPTDDRSEWHTTDEPDDVGEGGYLWFSDATLSSPRKSLAVILVALDARDAGSKGWRWRIAARIVEAAYPRVTRKAADGDPESTRMLPLFRWARWRLLSEPFREIQPAAHERDLGRGDSRPCGAPDVKDTDYGPDQPRAFARSAFRGCRSLRRRATESRVAWAEELLHYQDHPTLGRINVEHEGRLLVFNDESGDTDIEVNSVRDDPGNGPSPDSVFVTWFSREFFSRRFMVLDMWHTVPGHLKWAVCVFFIGAVASGVAIAVWPASTPNPLRWQWLATEEPIWLAGIGGVALLSAMVLLMVGVMSPGGERFSYPFLLRFAAATVIGSAAIVAMRGVWIARFSNPPLLLPSDCPQSVESSPAWLAISLIVGLVAAGLAYLVFEVRIHGTAGWRAVRRAIGVWMIGLGWALIIAAIDIVAISPTFTECFPRDLFGLGRVAAFLAIALASLDLGIFFQVLWEDRPVTYPLGALRFSRHT